MGIEEEVIKNFTKGNHENVVSIWENRGSEINISDKVIECVAFSYIALEQYYNSLNFISDYYEELLNKFPTQNKTLHNHLSNLTNAKLISLYKLRKIKTAYKTVNDYVDAGGTDKDVLKYQYLIESQFISTYISPVKNAIIYFLICFGVLYFVFNIKMQNWQFFLLAVIWVFLGLTFFYPSMSANFSRYLLRLIARIT